MLRCSRRLSRTPTRAGDRARAVLARDVEWVAPEVWKAELFSVLRGLTLGRKVDVGTAHRAVSRLPTLKIEQVALVR